MDKHQSSPPQTVENSELLTTQKLATTFRGLIMTAVAAVAAYAFYLWLKNPDGVGYDVNASKGLAVLLFVAIMWFTEAVNITITALMVPVLAATLGFPETNIKTALAGFADPTIYIFFGGFALSAALHIQKLDRKIAVWLLSLSRGDMMISILLLFGVTTFLSMWISNTATAAMMFPLAIGMMDHLDREKERKTFVFVLLGIAYCSSIGGLGTLVGSPPNMIAAKALDLDFSGWMKMGLPMMILILPMMLFSLYILLRPNFSQKVSIKEEHIPWTLHRVITMLIFICTAFAWIFSSKIRANFGISNPDTVIALTAAIAVIVFGTCRWKDIANNTDWGVLLLFGGGLTLSALLQSSGASAALGNQMAETFGSTHPLVIILAVATFIIFLTEFTSNTASAALLVPIFATIAAQMGMPKEVLVFVIGIGASCAFMLPVATPPNAIVFASGLIKQKEMMTVGLLLNILCIFVVGLWAYFVLM